MSISIAQPPKRVKRTPHVTLDADGNAVYRTKLLTLAQAVRFAACLRANPLFLCAEVGRPNRGGGAFVVYVPASTARQTALHDALQNRRVQRALAEGSEYSFWPDPDNPTLVWCLSASGEVYEIAVRDRRPIDCNCPDRAYRGRKAGLLCKHLIAWNRTEGLSARSLTSSDIPEPANPQSVGDTQVERASGEKAEHERCRMCDGLGDFRDWGRREEKCDQCGGTGIRRRG